VVRGDLVLPAGWPQVPEFLELLGDASENHGIEHLFPLRPDPLRPGRFTFEAKPVPRGPYVAYENQLRWHRRVRVGSDSTTFELRPGVPGRVTVRVKAGKDGDAPTEAKVWWRWSDGVEPGEDEGEGEPGDTRAPFDKAAEVFAFQAAPGTVSLTAQAKGFVAQGATIEVGPGSQQEHTFVLAPAAVLVVHVLEGGKPSTADVIVWVPDEDGRNGRETKTGKATFDDLAPDEPPVEVEVRTPGYEKVPLRTVRLVGGETTEVTFELKRLPR
jgi:hypothetical protein